MIGIGSTRCESTSRSNTRAARHAQKNKKSYEESRRRRVYVFTILLLLFPVPAPSFVLLRLECLLPHPGALPFLLLLLCLGPPWVALCWIPMKAAFRIMLC